MLRYAISALVLLALTPGPAPAQGAGGTGIDQTHLDQARYLLNVTRPNDRVGAVLDRLLAKLREADIDGSPGLGNGDIQLALEVEMAERRARAIAALLRQDLNGDMAVTADEVAVVARPEAAKPLRSGQSTILPTEAQIAEILADRVARVMSEDRNGDGRVTVDEATLSFDTPERRAEARLRLERATGIPGHFDIDADGTVTEAELRRVTETFLKLFDIDGDGAISGNERDASSRSLNQAQQAVTAQNKLTVSFGARQCRFPHVPKDAQVIVLGAAEGTGLTDLAVPGRHSADPVTMTQLDVPAGSTPIHLVASVRKPVLLKLAGPGADRVARVTSLAAPVLVTGARAETDAVPCPSMIWHMDAESRAHLHDTLRRGFRRADVALIAGWSLGRVDLATGANDLDARLDGARALAPATPPAGLKDQLLSYNPGGFHVVPVDEVLSTEEPAIARSIWPQQAGLLQLVADGALIPIPPTGAAAVRKRLLPGDPALSGFRTTPRGPENDPAHLFDGRIWHKQADGSWIGQTLPSFRATRAVTLPVGLQGAHTVQIVTADGVPRPTGDWVNPVAPKGGATGRKLPQIQSDG